MHLLGTIFRCGLIHIWCASGHLQKEELQMTLLHEDIQDIFNSTMIETDTRNVFTGLYGILSLKFFLLEDDGSEFELHSCSVQQISNEYCLARLQALVILSCLVNVLLI